MIDYIKPDVAKFREVGTTEWLSALVPGGVHTDLLALGHIPDPFVSDYELDVQWVAERNWEYRLTFAVTPEMLAQEHIVLVCDGLDTLAEVTFNNNRLGQTDNMFQQYHWDVTDLVTKGEKYAAHRFPFDGGLHPRKECGLAIARSSAGDPRWFLCAQGPLAVWLGLGAAASPHRPMERGAPGGLHRRTSGRCACTPGTQR